MDEYLNELIAYLVIAAVGILLGVVAFAGIRRRLRIRRSRQRHHRSAARLADRPALVVVPAEAPLPQPAEPESEEPAESHALDFFSAFEDRLAQIRAEIDALDTTPLR